MIQPGLERISLLLKHAPLPWKAVHVAGTNGKGSICAAVASMLHAAGLRCGRFTSPHLIDRWDCININGRPVSEELFRSVEDRIIRYDHRENIKASEFELLTATAFEIFTQENVDIGVVEVGLGGRLDATNVLQSPLITVISKIGLDHQAFLGDTLAQIAGEKAGILKHGVPCVVDSTNKLEVLDVIRKVAHEVQAGPLVLCGPLPGHTFSQLPQDLSNVLQHEREPFEQINLSCALEAVRQVTSATNRPFEVSRLLSTVVDKAVWPGRLQRMTLSSPLSETAREFILDGAHNEDGAQVLAQYLNTRHRQSSGSITWVLAASQGKDVGKILEMLLKDGDSVITVEFGPVDGMPWVRAMNSSDLLVVAQSKVSLKEAINSRNDLLSALKNATKSSDSLIVIAGSLYLVSDVLRLKRQWDEKHDLE